MVLYEAELRIELTNQVDTYCDAKNGNHKNFRKYYSLEVFRVLLTPQQATGNALAPGFTFTGRLTRVQAPWRNVRRPGYQASGPPFANS